MPWVKVRPGCSHRTGRGLLGPGAIFKATPAELASFGDKFDLTGRPAGDRALPDVGGESAELAEVDDGHTE